MKYPFFRHGSLNQKQQSIHTKIYMKERDKNCCILIQSTLYHQKQDIALSSFKSTTHMVN